LLSYFDIMRFELEEMEVNLFSSLLKAPSHILQAHEFSFPEILFHNFFVHFYAFMVYLNEFVFQENRNSLIGIKLLIWIGVF